MTPAPPSITRPAVPVWLDRLAAIGWRVIAVSALGIVIAAIAGVLASVTAAVLLALVRGRAARADRRGAPGPGPVPLPGLGRGVRGRAPRPPRRPRPPGWRVPAVPARSPPVPHRGPGRHRDRARRPRGALLGAHVVHQHGRGGPELGGGLDRGVGHGRRQRRDRAGPGRLPPVLPAAGRRPRLGLADRSAGAVAGADADLERRRRHAPRRGVRAPHVRPCGGRRDRGVRDAVPPGRAVRRAPHRGRVPVRLRPVSRRDRGDGGRRPRDQRAGRRRAPRCWSRAGSSSRPSPRTGR